MTVIVEVCGPFQRRPGYFRSRVMTRVWWGWFAVALLHIPLHEYADRTRYEWRAR